MTISVSSNRPLSCRSSSRAHTGAVGRRKQLVLQVRERLAVRVPGFVVAQVHLHQVHAASTSRRAMSSDQPNEFLP